MFRVCHAGVLGFAVFTVQVAGVAIRKRYSGSSASIIYHDHLRVV